jgi:RimJ/RimL family protein N-acetyltransferase
MAHSPQCGATAHAQGRPRAGRRSDPRSPRRPVPSSGCGRTDPLLLRDGTALTLRPIVPGDRGGLAALFARLTPQSRRLRFLGPKAKLTAAELTFLSEVDQARHGAVAAIDERDGAIVGVARYVCLSDRPDTADVAVVVDDAWQGRGIGTALARRALRGAQASGVTLIIASTLAENRAAHALLERFGFRSRGHASAGVAEFEVGFAAGE